MSELLKVKELKKYFPTKLGLLHAVDNVNFSIKKGTVFGVVGESGCGKSTLGRLLVRLLDPTEGRIIFDGVDITDRTKLGEYRKKMQMIFQDPYASLNPRMSVNQIIAEPLIINKMFRDHNEREKKVNELMETVGLAKRFSNSYPHELDGGSRQRIGIARALALSPQFIVCDEPVSALDVSIQAQILNLLQDLQEENDYTYMFITHDLSVIKHISNTTMVMYLGQTVEFSETEELFNNRLHPYTKALLAAIPEPVIKKKTKKDLLQGEIFSPIDPKPGCRFAPRCKFASDICERNDPVLKECLPGHFVACHRAYEINKIF